MRQLVCIALSTLRHAACFICQQAFTVWKLVGLAVVAGSVLSASCCKLSASCMSFRIPHKAFQFQCHVESHVPKFPESFWCACLVGDHKQARKAQLQSRAELHKARLDALNAKQRHTATAKQSTPSGASPMTQRALADLTAAQLAASKHRVAQTPAAAPVTQGTLLQNLLRGLPHKSRKLHSQGLKCSSGS